MDDDVQPGRPWTVILAAVVLAVAAVSSFIELDQRTGDGSTFTIGGPAFPAGVAIGMFLRWRSAWWAAVVSAVLGLVFTPFLLHKAGDGYVALNVTWSVLTAVLVFAPSTRAWMRDPEATELRLGALLLTIVVLSLAVSFAISAT